MHYTKMAAVACALALIFPLKPSLALSHDSLIKGTGPAVYFYSADGLRYVFPSEAVFKSWYPNYTEVVSVSDKALENIPYAGYVTFQPGSVLVKTPQDSKVYAVSRYGVLHWVQSEQLAQFFYGADWNTKVVDVSADELHNYLMSYTLDNPESYSVLTEMSYGVTPGDDIRPLNYVPPQASKQIYAVAATPATLTFEANHNQAVAGQTIKLTAQAQGNSLPLTDLSIWDANSHALLKSCGANATCVYAFDAPAYPYASSYYATVSDLTGQTATSGLATFATAPVAAKLQMSAAPQSVVTGGRMSVDSQYLDNLDIVSHRVWGMVAGADGYIPWLDCGKARECSGSAPLYNTTKFFSQIQTADGQTLFSAPITVAAQGGTIPAPVLTIVKQDTSSLDIALKVPAQDESVGYTFLVDGTDPSDPPLAMCQADCTLTVTLDAPHKLTAFTWVGGLYQKSQTLNVAP